MQINKQTNKIHRYTTETTVWKINNGQDSICNAKAFQFTIQKSLNSFKFHSIFIAPFLLLFLLQGKCKFSIKRNIQIMTSHVQNTPTIVYLNNVQKLTSTLTFNLAIETIVMYYIEYTLRICSQLFQAKQTIARNYC